MNRLPSSRRPARAPSRRGRAARAPLPVLVTALAVLGACAIVLPLVGLGTRVAWGRLPQLLSTPSAQKALWLSVRTCLIATAISVALGVPLSLLLARQWPGVRTARVVAVLPMTMPPVVAGIALLATLGKRGLLGQTLDAWGIPIAFSTAAVVVAQVFVSMPYLVVTLEAALRSRDTRAETIARTLGAGPWRILVRITLPLAAPALVRGTALALGRSLGEFGATIAFAGSKEGVTRTMPLAIYLERESDTATSLALAVVLIALSFLIIGTTNVRWTALAGGRRPTRGLAEEAGEADAPGTPRKPAPSHDGGAPAGVPDEPGGRGEPGKRGRELTVSFRLDARDVVVDLTVPAGRTVALVGPNGSGKSTVCTVVAGLLDAEGGRVVLGERVLDGPEGFVPAGRREVALLSQEPGVFTHMSVLSNVVFALRCQGASRQQARSRARSELAAVGASHLASRSGGALSGGQAARVALARALATRPRLLVLDEPMSALDVTARQEMRALVARRAAEEGLTALVVTHDVLDVTALADDVVVLEGGRVVERGATAQVLAAPVSDFAARLTGTAVLTGELAGDAEAPALELPHGQVVHGRPRDDAGARGEGLRPGGPGIALVPPDAVALYREPPEGSPRNVLAGRVTGVERAGALVSVSVGLAGGQGVRAVVTAGAVAEMGIAVGQELWCAIKAVEVRIVPRRAGSADGPGAGGGTATATSGRAER
ncbi:molybdate ABC transporter permease subunit [Actinomyces israelii]|uniref:Molybdate ABC transporter permease subunit n=1 Tax=Actinomyces israelii TaxID=1659 RepID=A0ABT4I6A5_9ACTO|nr:molybdate ABC transporter permease subunit [Actinomyces israelii]MCZ0856797.1 molybdate ABC transporter permease subunit [Actinomyces israelii]